MKETIESVYGELFNNREKEIKETLAKYEVEDLKEKNN